MHMKKLVCIINPIAGKGNGRTLADIISKNLDSNVYDFSIRFTEYAGHAGQIAAEAAAQGVDVVIAVGGDGTVNEVASKLSGTNTALAIIPRGSGNGLANHLGLPKNIRENLALINKGTVACIDTACVNDHPFFCTCGVGYDAKVAMDYAKAGTRGLITYVRKTLEAWHSYAPGTYHITTDNADFEIKAFLITIGNANQWGNNYHITPRASLQDGLLDITIIHPFNLLQAIPIPIQLLDSHIYHNSKVDALRSGHIRIERLPADHDASVDHRMVPSDAQRANSVAQVTHSDAQMESSVVQQEAHFDGEAFMAGPVLDIRITPANLNVIVP